MKVLQLVPHRSNDAETFRALILVELLEFQEIRRGVSSSGRRLNALRHRSTCSDSRAFENNGMRLSLARKMIKNQKIGMERIRRSVSCGGGWPNQKREKE